MGAVASFDVGAVVDGALAFAQCAFRPAGSRADGARLNTAPCRASGLPGRQVWIRRLRVC